MKKIYLNILRILGTLLFIALVLSKADIKSIMPSLKNIQVIGLIFSFVIFFAIQILSTLRWHILLSINELKIRFQYLFHANAVSMLSGLFFPTNFGTDLVRLIYAAKEKGVSKRKAVVGTVGDRLFGMTTMSIMFFFGLLLSDYLTKNQKMLLSFLLLFLFTFAVFALVMRKIILRYMMKKSAKLPFGKLIKKVLADLESFSGKDIMLLLFISILINLASIYYNYQLFKILGVNVTFLMIFIAYPIKRFINLLPISIGGLGANEVTMWALLSPFGITIEQVIAYSGLSYLVLILSSLIYLIPGLFSKHESK